MAISDATRRGLEEASGSGLSVRPTITLQGTTDPSGNVVGGILEDASTGLPRFTLNNTSIVDIGAIAAPCHFIGEAMNANPITLEIQVTGQLGSKWDVVGTLSIPGNGADSLVLNVPAKAVRLVATGGTGIAAVTVEM
jgi:hypothetical protein